MIKVHGALDTWDAEPVFDSLGARIARAPKTTILVWLVITVACFAVTLGGVTGQTLFDRLSSGAPAVPGSDSTRADEILRTTATSGPSLTLVVQHVDLADAALAAPVDAARTALLAVPGVSSVIDPFVVPGGPSTPAAAPLVAADGAGFLVVVELDRGMGADAQATALATVEDQLRALPGTLTSEPGATGQVGGSSLIVDEITGQVRKDLEIGEAISMPVALLVMVLVFGGMLSAGMPLLGAVASIAGGLGSVFALSHWLEMDSSVVNVVSLLGLGLSIDYGLLIVSRFREELHKLVDEGGARRRRHGDGAVRTALRRTMDTAGRTVTFSALTVAIAISGLTVFQPSILRAFGAGGVAVILVAVATAMTLVPALLVLAGRRLERPSVVSRVPLLRRIIERTGDVRSEEGVFSRLAERVQRHPWLVVGGSLAILAVLASPLHRMELRNSTVELLPVGSDQRTYVETIAKEYPASRTPTATIVAQGTLDEVTAWSHGLAALPGVAAVGTPVARDEYVVIGVDAATQDAGGAVARSVVEELRAHPARFPTYVTGQAANQIDFVQALIDRVGWAALIVIVATFVLLFLMTSSVVIPIKALLTNALSLAASMGVLVWVFQDGHLSGPLGFESTGGIETYVVALIVAFGFGLAMDYEVFLLSRIKELWDAGRSNDDAVRLGLQRSGRIITSAAIIIIVVFAGFVFGKLLVIKEVGFSLAFAVAIDATLVRMLLVPATMTLLGKYNWWAPAWMKKISGRFAIEH